MTIEVPQARNPIRLSGYYSSLENMPKLDAITTGRPDRIQQDLNSWVERGEGTKGEFGELMKVITWTGLNMDVAIFDFTTGQQIGIGQAMYDPDIKERETFNKMPIYMTGFIIASQYERLGLAYLTRTFLKSYLAAQSNEGIFLESEIAATGQNRNVAKRILMKSGAKRSNIARAGKGELWTEILNKPSRQPPDYIRASDIILSSKKVGKRPSLDQSIEQRGKDLYFDRVRVARVNNKEIEFYPPTADNYINFWQGIQQIWRSARSLGYSPRIRPGIL